VYRPEREIKKPITFTIGVKMNTLRNKSGADGNLQRRRKMQINALAGAYHEKTGEKDEGVYRYLDVSTCHVTPPDMQLLRTSEAIIARVHEYGCFVHVPDFADEGEMEDRIRRIREEKFSEEFLNLLAYAYFKGCFWINLDADGLIHKELPDLSKLWESEESKSSAREIG
jgi:hypothetical protein